MKLTKKDEGSIVTKHKWLGIYKVLRVYSNKVTLSPDLSPMGSVENEGFIILEKVKRKKK